MKLTYPAVFEPYEDGNGFVVTVPDLPGCTTGANSLADAILMAEDAASGWVLTELEEGNLAPASSDVSSVKVPEGCFVSLLALDMDAYAEKYGDKAVRKNLTIPAWLATFADSRNINYSKVLTDALNGIYTANA